MKTLRTQLPIFGCMALMLMIAACQPSAPPQTKAEAPPIAVKTVQPRRGEITRWVTLPGNVTPNQHATLFAKVTGYLEKISVDKGDAVKKGDFIASIEAPELLADLAKFKADLEVADVDYQRTLKAQEKAPDLVVRQTIDAAKAKSLTAKASLDRAETMLGFCKITAPFSGVITRRFVDAGAFIPAATAGSSAQGAAIVTLMDFSVVRVQVAVPEPETPFIQKSLPAQITIDELHGQPFSGTISRFSHSLDETKTMLIEIDLENPNDRLLPGMYATVKIGVEKKTDALLLPAEAVLIEKAGTSVFTIADGKAKKQSVRIGFNDGLSIEILDGVKQGEPVILIGGQTLNNGQRVTTQPAEAGTPNQGSSRPPYGVPPLGGQELRREFPFTPALSPGEREVRITGLPDSPRVLAGPFAYVPGRTEPNSPLPWGEGRGEGTFPPLVQ